jgi:hypothetical protein
MPAPMDHGHVQQELSCVSFILTLLEFPSILALSCFTCILLHALFCKHFAQGSGLPMVLQRVWERSFICTGCGAANCFAQGAGQPMVLRRVWERSFICTGCGNANCFAQGTGRHIVLHRVRDCRYFCTWCGAANVVYLHSVSCVKSCVCVVCMCLEACIFIQFLCQELSVCRLHVSRELSMCRLLVPRGVYLHSVSCGES